MIRRCLGAVLALGLITGFARADAVINMVDGAEVGAGNFHSESTSFFAPSPTNLITGQGDALIEGIDQPSLFSFAGFSFTILNSMRLSR